MFEDLFVFELANNHLGDYKRALAMIDECARVVDSYDFKINAAIKFQLRDAGTFVHKDYRSRNDIRYVRKVLDSVLENSEYEKLYNHAKGLGFLRASTPFDETAVKMCMDFDVDIIKIASSDIKNISLLKNIALLKKPVIASLGGADIQEADNLVTFFELNNIPLALNHCISLYPCNDEDLNLGKISHLKNRYPNHTVGFSTHQSDKNIVISIPCAYAYGARMIERHIDIECDGKIRLPYTTRPQDLRMLIDSYFCAKKMSFQSNAKECLTREKEHAVIKKFTRGVYAKKDLLRGCILAGNDFYYAAPCKEGQLTHNDRIENLLLLCNIKKDEPIMASAVQKDVRV